MNVNNLQAGTTRVDRLILLIVMITLVALANLRGYGAAAALKLMLRAADAVVNALLAFAA